MWPLGLNVYWWGEQSEWILILNIYIVCQTSTSVRGTLCCAVEASASTQRAASSAFAPRDTRSPPMGRPVWVSDGINLTFSLFFASFIFVHVVLTGAVYIFKAVLVLLGINSGVFTYYLPVLLENTAFPFPVVSQLSCSIANAYPPSLMLMTSWIEALCDPIMVLQAQLFALFQELCYKNNEPITEVIVFIISAEVTCFRIKVTIINLTSKSD